MSLLEVLNGFGANWVPRFQLADRMSGTDQNVLRRLNQNHTYYK
jgi:hypothetical protein